MGKYIIRKDDNEIAKDFYQFLYDFVTEKNRDKSFKSVEYDNWLYNAVLSLNDIVCRENIRPISIANSNDILKLLIPNRPEYIISDTTYLVLWRTLQQQLFYDKTNWIFEYWTHAHQYICLTLKPIEKDIDYSKDIYVIKDKEEVEKRDEQIARFKEFHLALCGMILYSQKYDLIKNVTGYSQSQPYSFPLVPSTFHEIFHLFNKLNQSDPQRSLHFDRFYSFIGIKGVDAGNISLGWTNRFLTLLLYRLNSPEVNYMSSWIKPWETPSIPDSFNECTSWLTIAEQMKYFIEEWEAPDGLKIIDSLGWSAQEGEDQPLQKINQFIEGLKSFNEEKRTNIEHSNDKVKVFNDSSKKIIRKAVKPYLSIIKNCITPSPNYKKDIINVSISRPMDKEAFSGDQITTFANFDKILAQSVVYEFFYQSSLSVYQHTKGFHTITDEHLFEALDRMIGEKRTEYCVIAFDTYLDFYINEAQVNLNLVKIENGDKNYPEYSYKNDLKIYSLPSNSNPLMKRSLAIIKKEDLPCFVANDPPKETKEKLQLKLIDNVLKVYTSILFGNYLEEDQKMDQHKYCRATIYFCPLLYWKKSAVVTVLKLISRFADSGKGAEISTLPEL
ncbi:MAG: hypothetical protein VB048_04415 [Bacteroidaceae bacterium]|nr:hypothetical protein [Bacteroidaceae bacterium]